MDKISAHVIGNELVAAKVADEQSRIELVWGENPFECPSHHHGDWTLLNEVLKNGG